MRLGKVSIEELRERAQQLNMLGSHNPLNVLLAAVNVAIEVCDEDDNCKICRLRAARDKYLRETA